MKPDVFVEHRITWLVNNEHIYEDLIKKKMKNSLWGLKDPKLCFTIDCFVNISKHIGLQLKIINTERQFNDIIRSFTSESFGKQSRYNWETKMFEDSTFSNEEAKTITNLYLQAKNNFLEHYKGDMLTVNYPDVSVEKIAQFVGLPVNEKAMAFVKPELCHYNTKVFL
jgi:hypothetical protein